jgi:DNA-binding IscR family transcriptional regulator
MHGYYILLVLRPEYQGAAHMVCHIAESDAAHVSTVVEVLNKTRDLFEDPTVWPAARVLSLPVCEMSQAERASAGMALSEVVDWEKLAGDLSRQPNMVTQIILNLRKAVGQCLKALRREAIESMSDGHPALTPDHEAILRAMGTRPTKCWIVSELLGSPSRNRETVGRLLRELKDMGLVHRPHGVKKGYALTEAGRKWLSGASAVTTPAHR